MIHLYPYIRFFEQNHNNSITRLFTWRHTRQGHEFWERIHTYKDEITDEIKLKAIKNILEQRRSELRFYKKFRNYIKRQHFLILEKMFNTVA